MQKVYLLLRNNRQSGPFSIDELLQQQLRPSDMVWIEGRSTAWAYLSELELLPSHPDEARISASQPRKRSDDIETKAEEIRQRALAYGLHTPRTFIPSQIPPVQSREEVPQEEVELIDHRKERYSVAGEILMTVLIIGIFAGGIYGGRTLFFDQSDVNPRPEVTRINSSDQHQAVKRVEQPKAQAPVVSDSLQSDSLILAALPRPKPPVPKKGTVKVLNLDSITRMAVQDKDLSGTIPDEKLQEEDTVSRKEVKAEEKPDIQQEEKDRKKGLGHALKSIFKKKKKDNAPVADTTGQ